MFKLIAKIPFWFKTLIGMGLGIAVGLYWGKAALPVLDPIGDGFINLIKMLVVPLVFFTIISSIAKLGQDGGGVGAKSIGLGIHTLILFMLTSALAVGVGFGVGLYFEPGLGVGVLPLDPSTIKVIPTPIEVLTGIIPSNIFDSLAKGKVLSIVFIAILAGAAMASLGEKTKPLQNLMEQASQTMFKLTRWIIQLTPIGVFGLIGSVVAAYGLESLTPLLGFIGCIYLGCIIQLLVVYPILLKLYGLKVFAFYKGIFSALQTAFFTCSSIGTLPVSLSVAVENLKLNPSYVGFALPLGANMKMDGCGAIYPAISSIFIANYYGIELTQAHYIIIALSSILGSLATAGVPGVATVMLTVTLSAAGLPLEGLALLAAIDRIIDMIRTTTNVTGQILVPTLVSKVHKLIDLGSPLLKKAPQLNKTKA